jgi:hypothetical protein
MRARRDDIAFERRSRVLFELVVRARVQRPRRVRFEFIDGIAQGATLSEWTLVPGDDATLAETRFEDWLSQSATAEHSPA